jgi:DNA modification methylase
VLPSIPAATAQTIVTSPPYWGLRDYGEELQIGLEDTPEEYVGKLVAVFQECRRTLVPSGTLWLNLGDTYAGYHGNRKVPDHLAPSNKPGYRENQRKSTVGVSGLKQKDLVGIPWMVAFALRASGWYLRQDVIWSKPDGGPETAKDRPTTSHEHLFLLSVSPRYYYDGSAVREKPATPGGVGRSLRSVWTVPVAGGRSPHRSRMPAALVETCIRATSRAGDTVLDPFAGSGTTLRTAVLLGRRPLGIELVEEFAEHSRGRVILAQNAVSPEDE